MRRAPSQRREKQDGGEGAGPDEMAQGGGDAGKHRG